MINDCIDDAISNGLGNYLLSLLYRIQLELVLDVDHRNLRVTDVQFLETELEHSMLKSSDQVEVLIGNEYLLVFRQDFLESIHIA